MIDSSMYKLLITCFLISITSCSSNPPFLSPTKELVASEQVQLGDEVPVKYNSFLEGLEGQTRVIDKLNISLGLAYTSALGQRCKILFVLSFESIDANPQKRIVCKQTQSSFWLLIPSIVIQNNKDMIFSP